MTTITIELPDDVFSASGALRRNSPARCASAAAIQWYSQGLISQGKAAEIAGLDRTEFLYSLAQAKVDAFQISSEELKEEVAFDLQGVVNASPLIFLTRVGLLEVLHEAGIPVVVPDTVFTELGGRP